MKMLCTPEVLRLAKLPQITWIGLRPCSWPTSGSLSAVSTHYSLSKVPGTPEHPGVACLLRSSTTQLTEECEKGPAPDPTLSQMEESLPSCLSWPISLI